MAFAELLAAWVGVYVFRVVIPVSASFVLDIPLGVFLSLAYFGLWFLLRSLSLQWWGAVVLSLLVKAVVHIILITYLLHLDIATLW